MSSKKKSANKSNSKASSAPTASSSIIAPHPSATSSTTSTSVLKKSVPISSATNATSSGGVEKSCQPDMYSIQRKLAELEIARGDDDISKNFLADLKREKAVLTESDQAQLIQDLNDLLNSESELDQSDDDSNREWKAENIAKMRQTFIAIITERKNSKKRFTDRMEVMKTLCSKRTSLLAEKLDLESKVAQQSSGNDQVQKIYGDLQEKIKKVRETTAQMLSTEEERTEGLKKQCEESINDLTKKLENDDQEITGKQVENDDLRGKLEQLRHHFKQSKEHSAHQLKTKSLEKQLYEAKLAQKNSIDYKRQAKLLTNEKTSTELQVSIHELQAQLQMYKSKSSEFEDTFQQSKNLFIQFKEQQDLMVDMAAKLEAENKRLTTASQEGDARLFKSIDQFQASQTKLLNMKKDLAKKEKKCRQLQAKRNDLSEKSRSAAVVSLVDADEISENDIDLHSSSSSSSSKHVTPTGVGGDSSPSSSSSSSSKSL